eukprot:1524017-Rhodomonas_salina.1
MGPSDGVPPARLRYHTAKKLCVLTRRSKRSRLWYCSPQASSYSTGNAALLIFDFGVHLARQ